MFPVQKPEAAWLSPSVSGPASIRRQAIPGLKPPQSRPDARNTIPLGDVIGDTEPGLSGARGSGGLGVPFAGSLCPAWPPPRMAKSAAHVVSIGRDGSS